LKAFVRIVMAVLLLFVLAAPPARALNETACRIDALGMSVELPDDMVVFMKDFEPDDPNLALLGIDRSMLESYFEEEGGLLLAFSLNSGLLFEIYTDFNELSLSKRDMYRLTDAELTEASDAISSAFRELGLTDITVDLYNQKQTKFELISYTDPALGSGYLQAYTIADLREIRLLFSDFSNQAIQGQMDTCMQVIDSISFDAYANESHARYYAGILKKDSDTANAGGQSEEPLFSGSTLTLIGLGFIFLIVVIRARRNRAAVNSAGYQDDVPPDTRYAHKPEPPVSPPPFDTVRCPDCGAVNRSDRDACYRCGKALNQGAENAEDDGDNADDDSDD
jgi:hypothetical protein